MHVTPHTCKELFLETSSLNGMSYAKLTTVPLLGADVVLILEGFEHGLGLQLSNRIISRSALQIHI